MWLQRDVVVVGMLRAARLFVSPQGVRRFGDSVLGTSTFSAQLIREINEEMAVNDRERRGAPRTTFINCIRQGELDHMESPESDERAKVKLDGMIENLFSKLPTPSDPMAAALMKTPEEEAKEDHLEALRDEVRERYRNSQRRSRVESQRIAKAMDHVQSGSHQTQTQEAMDETLLVAAEPDHVVRERELQLEIAAMKARVAQLEAALANKKT